MAKDKREKLKPPFVSIYEAALCRSLYEGGDGRDYIEFCYDEYKEFAIEHLLLDENGELTEVGERLGEACLHLDTDDIVQDCVKWNKVIQQALPTKGKK